jgi:thiol-disulfide isomerase/thioredoxin
MPHSPASTTTTVNRGRRRTLLIAVLIVAVSGAGAVLYSALSAPAQPTLATPAGSAAGDAAAPGALTARTLDGGQIVVPGNRPSVLLFFSVECGGCGPSAQALAQAQQATGNRANFVAVDVAGYETEADVKRFLSSYHATTLAYALDTHSTWARTYQVNQLSTAIILNSQGKEVFRAVEPSAEQIRAALAKVTA